MNELIHALNPALTLVLCIVWGAIALLALAYAIDWIWYNDEW